MNVYRLFFKAFSNETRLGIIHLLRKKPLTVGEIADKLGFEQSRVSHNLRCLEQCGFVNVIAKGNHRVYALDKEVILPIVQLFEKHVKKYEKKLLCCDILKK